MQTPWTALAEYSQQIEVKTTSMIMIRMVCIISGLPCPTMALRTRASYISCYIDRDANYEYLPGRYDLRALRTAMLLYLHNFTHIMNNNCADDYFFSCRNSQDPLLSRSFGLLWGHRHIIKTPPPRSPFDPFWGVCWWVYKPVWGVSPPKLTRCDLPPSQRKQYLRNVLSHLL